MSTNEDHKKHKYITYIKRNASHIKRYLKTIVITFIFLLLLLILSSRLNITEINLVGHVINLTKIISGSSVFVLLSWLFALFITILISQTQNQQLSELKKIGVSTRETAETLKTKSMIEGRVQKFFYPASKDEHKLLFPGEYTGKTLPSINAADSYAMHVISNYLGSNLKLKVIPRKICEDTFQEEEFDCNAILMCGVNPALKFLYKFTECDGPTNAAGLPCWFVKYKTGSRYYNESCKINICCDSVANNPLVSPVEDYCIFSSEYYAKTNESVNKIDKLRDSIEKMDNASDNPNDINLIQKDIADIIKSIDEAKEILIKYCPILSMHNQEIETDIDYHIKSLNEVKDKLNIVVGKNKCSAETNFCHILCEKLQYLQNNSPGSKLTHADYGIFGRLSSKGNESHKHIIIAGMHGFGTWIVAHYLNMILSGGINCNQEHNEIFFGTDDFIAIVEGSFLLSSFSVKRARIYDDYIWVKKKNRWKIIRD